MDRHPGNYLRTHRKRSGLSQRDVAALLGYSDQDSVSRHELVQSTPPLLIALAYEAVFHVPVAKIFSGMYQTVVQNVEERLADFEQNLHNRSGSGPQAELLARKLEWIAQRGGNPSV